MSQPEYQEINSESIPEVQSDGVRIRLLAGQYANQQGAVHDPNTNVQYFDIHLEGSKTFLTNTPATHNAFVYVYEGSAQINNANLPRHSLTILSEGDSLTLQAGESGARLIFVSGQPIKEPIVQYGPFVMNTRAEIEQAFADYQSGKFANIKADMKIR